MTWCMNQDPGGGGGGGGGGQVVRMKLNKSRFGCMTLRSNFTTSNVPSSA